MLRLDASRWRRFVFAPLAMLALAIQCLVIQTHIDIHRAPSGATVIASTVAAPDGRDPLAPGAVCPVCQASLSNVMALGGTPTLLVGQAFQVAASREFAPALQRALPSHIWRSRAPPQA